MKNTIAMHPNPLVRFLKKPAAQFTKEDIIRFAEENDIEMVNFRYAGEDGRLKSLNFVINNKEHLESILDSGERVDGSSLFKHIEAGSSDLYVVPKYRTTFVNPFSPIPSIDILCEYFDAEGQPFAGSPENIMMKAHEALQKETGYSFEVMGELEYYVISDIDPLFPATDQRNYHESEPFAKYGDFRCEALRIIAQCGGLIKYGHSEVGNFTQDGLMYEQNEIEFLPCNVEDAANHMVIAKWILRTLALQYGLNLTFAPKITVGKAGSGLHIHTRLMKDGKNVMTDSNGLSDVAKKAIAGYLDLAASLTAFGNTNPTSYFRLVPHQEAPTNICWGDRNRSVLVRVPLGWKGNINMAAIANPIEENKHIDFSDKQTVEFRCPDGSANIYLLIAGLTVAARHGLQMENALEFAKKTYVDVDIFNKKYQDRTKDLKQLPTCCEDSAEALKEKFDVYAKYGVFTEDLLKNKYDTLKEFSDKNLRKEIENNPKQLLEIVQKYFHV